MVIQLNDLVTVRLTLSCYSEMITTPTKTEYKSIHITHHRAVPCTRNPLLLVLFVELHHSIAYEMWIVGKCSIFSRLANIFLSLSFVCVPLLDACVYGNLFVLHQMGSGFKRESGRIYNNKNAKSAGAHIKPTERTKCAQKLMLTACYGCERAPQHMHVNRKKRIARDGEWVALDLSGSPLKFYLAL